MELNKIRDIKGARKTSKRVGRGLASGKGKTSGRGQKGQKARTGVAVSGFEGGQMPIYRRLPMRGFTNIFKVNYAEVNLGKVQKAIDEKKIDAAKDVDASALRAAGLIGSVKGGVRLLGSGEIKAKVKFVVAGVTKSAKEAVEKAGGEVVIVDMKAVKREAKAAEIAAKKSEKAPAKAAKKTATKKKA